MDIVGDIYYQLALAGFAVARYGITLCRFDVNDIPGTIAIITYWPKNGNYLDWHDLGSLFADASNVYTFGNLFDESDQNDGKSHFYFAKFHATTLDLVELKHVVDFGYRHTSTKTERYGDSAITAMIDRFITYIIFYKVNLTTMTITLRKRIDPPGQPWHFFGGPFYRMYTESLKRGNEYYIIINNHNYPDSPTWSKGKFMIFKADNNLDFLSSSCYDATDYVPGAETINTYSTFIAFASLTTEDFGTTTHTDPVTVHNQVFTVLTTDPLI